MIKTNQPSDEALKKHASLFTQDKRSKNACEGGTK